MNHKFFSSDLIDALVEIMSMKNTIEFEFIHDKNSGPNHFKTVTGFHLKTKNKTVVFKNGPYFRYEFQGDLLEILTNPRFDKRNSVVVQILHNFENEMKFNGSRRGKKTTSDRTVIQRYLYSDFFPEKEAPEAIGDHFDSVF